MPSRTPQDELYEEAAKAYGRGMERLVRAYEADAEKQSDLLQEIHLALWQSLENFEGRCSLRTWVYRVAHNTAASHALTERKSKAAEWLTLASMETVQSPQDDSPDRGLAMERLTDLIRRLKPLDREVMLLYLEEMDAASIGEITGLSVSNVRVHIHRIKAVLAKQFRGGFGDG